MKPAIGAKARSLAWALLINALFLAAVLAFFFAYFEGNDDQGMFALLGGTYDGQPTPFLVFIGMAISYPLMLLTSAMPDVPWYALFEYALVFASFTAASNVLIRRERRSGIVLSLLLLCAFGFDCYTQMQFTKAAGCAIAAGALVMLDALAGRRARVPAAVAGALLFILGTGYRFRMFPPVLALTLPAALFIAVRQLRRGRRARVLRALAWFAAVLAISCGLNLWSQAMYNRDEAWSRYMRYNADRSQLLDRSFPDYAENADLYRALDITESDVQLYRRWVFADPDRFNAESVHALAQARSETKIDAAFWREFAEKIPAGYLRYAWIPAFLIAAALAVYASRRNILYLVCGIAVLAALSVYLMYYGRYLVRRVDVCLFFALTLSMLYIFQNTAAARDVPSARKTALCLCLTAALFVPTFASYAQQSGDAAARTAQNREIGDMIGADDDHIYLVSVLSANFMWNGFTLWQTCPPEYSRNVCMLGGCTSYTPIWNEMNARRGIENPFAWCIDNDRAYLLTNNRISPIIGYIRRHFDPDADYLLAKQIDDHSFYRIVTKNPKPGIESDVIDAPAPNLRAEDVSFSRSGRNLNVSGRVWLEGTSSYRGEAWLELAGDDGKTRFRLMTQYEAEAPDADGAPPGDLHGQFSKYTVSCTLPKRFSGRASILYRSGDAWYRVPVADLDE